MKRQTFDPLALPPGLERDTLLMPEVIAETVVQEAERFLRAELPVGFADRLAARAFYLYERNRHFKKTLNLPGDRGRDSLYMFMRHWTAGWLRRERPGLRQKLPMEQGLGHPLPSTGLKKSFLVVVKRLQFKRAKAGR